MRRDTRRLASFQYVTFFSLDVVWFLQMMRSWLVRLVLANDYCLCVLDRGLVRRWAPGPQSHGEKRRISLQGVSTSLFG